LRAKKKPRPTKAQRDLLLLNVLNSQFAIFFINSKVDAAKSPMVVNAFVRLPIHDSRGKFKGWEPVELNIKIDKLLRRAIEEFQEPYRRFLRGRIKDVTFASLFAGLYAPLRFVWKFRSKITYSLKQLPFDSKVRKTIYFRLKRARIKYGKKA